MIFKELAVEDTSGFSEYIRMPHAKFVDLVGKIAPFICTMRSVNSHEVTRRCNISLGDVPATFSCVCICCDFVPATCPRYTTLMHFASVCTTHLFVAATCPCKMTPRICPPLRILVLLFFFKKHAEKFQMQSPS